MIARGLVFGRRGVIFFGDSIQPGCRTALDVKLSCSLGGRRAVPMRYAGTSIGGLAGAQFQYGAAFHLSAADAFFDQDDLPAFMDMPFGTSSRVKVDMSNAGLGVIFQPLDVTGEVGLLFLLGVNEPQAGGEEEQAQVEQAEKTTEAEFASHLDGHRSISNDPATITQWPVFEAGRSSRELPARRPLRRRFRTNILRRRRSGGRRRPGLGFVLQSAFSRPGAGLAAGSPGEAWGRVRRLFAGV